MGRLPQLLPRHRRARMVAAILFTIAGMLLLQEFVARPYAVPTSSMYPAIHPGDRILVERSAYRYGAVERGDIVVIAASESARLSCGVPRDVPLMKRVVGVPGDIVYLPGDGSTWVNGNKLEIPGVSFSGAEVGFPPVPAGQVLVLGDNRADSCDARAWFDERGNFTPFLPMSGIQGRADAVLWPPTRIQRLR